MSVKPRYYYNLIGNIANEKEEFGTRLMHKEDLNEPFMDNTEKGSDSLLDLLNKYDKENEQLKQAYSKLKHRHSLLHDVCLDLECDKDRYYKDVLSLEEENKELKQENQEYIAILKDIGILMSDEDVINIRNDIADKFLKPLFKSNGFDVDIDTTDGFTIIPKGDVE